MYDTYSSEALVPESNPAAAPVNNQKIDLLLKFTDIKGFTHELQVTKQGDAEFAISVGGNSQLLTSKLEQVISALARYDRQLF